MSYSSFIFSPRWNKGGSQATIAWDVAGYYWYLPSIIIYHDLKHQSFKDSIIKKYHPFQNNFDAGFLYQPSGNYVMKYASGMSILYLPFFIIAHFFAKPLGFPADGFSVPYQFAIQFGGLFFSLLGLWLFKKFLRKKYSDAATAITLLTLVIGTNFLNYGAIDTGMSHAWLFTIYVLMLMATERFYANQNITNAAILGALIGFVTLVRPNEIVSLLIPLLWGLESFSSSAIKKHFSFLQKNWQLILICFISGAIIFSIQLFYWKYVSGKWFVYSYEDQGFHWKKPAILHYLFGPQNGWWQYAPVMGLCFFNFLFFLKNKNAIAIISFSFVFLYIISCWTAYWYGGRFMVETYPILFIPFAYGIERLLAQRLLLKLTVLPIILLFVYVGLWSNIQYHYGNLYEFETCTWKYYFSVVGRWHVNDEVFKLKDAKEIFLGTPRNTRLLFSNNFEKDTAFIDTLQPIAGKHSVYLDDKSLCLSYFFAIPKPQNKWIRVSSCYHYEKRENYIWSMPQTIVSFLKGKKVVKESMLRAGRFVNDGETKNIYLDIKSPSDAFDSVRVSYWNPNSNKRLLIDDLKVIGYDE